MRHRLTRAAVGWQDKGKDGASKGKTPLKQTNTPVLKVCVRARIVVLLALTVVMAHLRCFQHTHAPAGCLRAWVPLVPACLGACVCFLCA